MTSPGGGLPERLRRAAAGVGRRFTRLRVGIGRTRSIRATALDLNQGSPKVPLSVERFHRPPCPADSIAFAPCGPGGRRPERIEQVLSELGVYWRQQPHLRLGQIVDNFAKALAVKLDLTGNLDAAARELEDDALLGMLSTGHRHPLDAACEYLDFVERVEDQLGCGEVPGRE